MFEKYVHVPWQVCSLFPYGSLTLCSCRSRQCRTSSVGPAHTLRIEQRLPIVRSDGQDSGIEDLGMASPGSPVGIDRGTKTTLGQKVGLLMFVVSTRCLL